MTLDLAVGASIRTIRKRKGWFVIDLADEIPMSRSYLSEVENGHKLPSIGLLGDIATALQIPVAELWLEIYKHLKEE
jgi:transcriptional regulator with XRE-family HTH domain